MTKAARIVELDVLRGFAVAVMILVVSPGDWGQTFPQLRHADWHGWTFGDLVFPDFLFGVGMALGLTFVNPAAGHNQSPWRKTFRRVALLIALGIFLNSLAVFAFYLGAPPIGKGEVTTLRIPGILQRIALCYLIAFSILTVSGPKSEKDARAINLPVIVATIAAILVGYWALLTFVPVPGFGAGRLDQEGNLGAFIDRAIFTPQHMWRLGTVEWAGRVVFDPEGLLSSLPATANVLFGVVAISIWRTGYNLRLLVLAGIGIALIAAALMLDPFFPINKKIWTSSFALLSSGFSFLALVTAALMMSSPLVKHVATPFKILGGNAILAFSLSIFLTALASIPLTDGAGPTNLRSMAMALASSVIASPLFASFAVALGVVGLIFAIIWPLDRKGIHLRL